MFDSLFNYIKVLALQISKRVFQRELYFYCFFHNSHLEPFDNDFKKIYQIIIKPQKLFTLNRFDYGTFQEHLKIVNISSIFQLLRICCAHKHLNLVWYVDKKAVILLDYKRNLLCKMPFKEIKYEHCLLTQRNLQLFFLLFNIRKHYFL